MFDQHAFVYVDDDRLSREVMALILENGMGVKDRLTIFSDSHDFLAQLDALIPSPDIFFLDIHVKPLDGFQMLSMLRSHEKYAGAKIIALTASVMNEEVLKLRACGFDSAIGKPLGIKTFPALLARILSGEQIWHVT